MITVSIKLKQLSNGALNVQFWSDDDERKDVTPTEQSFHDHLRALVLALMQAGAVGGVMWRRDSVTLEPESKTSQ